MLFSTLRRSASASSFEADFVASFFGWASLDVVDDRVTGVVALAGIGMRVLTAGALVKKIAEKRRQDRQWRTNARRGGGYWLARQNSSS